YSVSFHIVPPEAAQYERKKGFARPPRAPAGALPLHPVRTAKVGYATVAKLPRLSYTIFNSFERDDSSDGKARTETVPCGSSRSRTGFASHDGAALDQSWSDSSGPSGPRGACSPLRNRADRGQCRWASARVVWAGEWTGATR